MIGKLRGKIESISDNHIIIDVNGVGYEVFCHSILLSNIEIGQNITIIIETHVREDQISLYGFVNHEEREWFRLLTTVKGVGTKVAMAILGAIEAGSLLQAIATNDRALFTSISGIGGKLADRILTELKDKHPRYLQVINTLPKSNRESVPSVKLDAVSALVNLGYARNESHIAVTQALIQCEYEDLEMILKYALKELVK